MSTGDKWGVGSKVDEKAFDTVLVGKTEVELFFGEHPHSRQDNNVYARFPGGRIEGFDGHRRPVAIEIEESNYVKESELSGDEVRKSCRWVVKLAGVAVDGGGGRNHEWAMRQIAYRLPRIQEHPVDWVKGDYVGRKVYYKGVPAVVAGFHGDEGEVVLVAETGLRFPPPVYAKEPWELEYAEEYAERTTADVLSGDVWWFRD